MNRLLIRVAILLGSAIFVSAQRTIFNVPTTDVLGRGQVQMEIDAAFKFNDEIAVRRFSSFAPRVVVGVDGNIEAGLNVTGNIQHGADSTTIVPTVKWKFFENKKKNTALIAGTNFYIPVAPAITAFPASSSASPAALAGRSFGEARS